MFYAKKLLAALVVPPNSLLLLALLGILLAASSWRWGRRLGLSIAALACVAVLALSMPGVSASLLQDLEDYGPVSEQQLKQAQAIVVLGGGAYRTAREYGGETVNDYGLARVRYAARLARQSGLPVLITGGSPQGGRSEAELMREVMEKEFGVKVRWLETTSRDTGENAALSAPLLKAAGVERVALVSHAWHMRRAIPLFEREGLQVIPAPTIFHQAQWSGLGAWLPTSADRSRIAFHERIGHWVDQLSR